MCMYVHIQKPFFPDIMHKSDEREKQRKGDQGKLRVINFWRKLKRVPNKRGGCTCA